jgi:hypothetical protein
LSLPSKDAEPVTDPLRDIVLAVVNLLADDAVFALPVIEIPTPVVFIATGFPLLKYTGNVLLPALEVKAVAVDAFPDKVPEIVLPEKVIYPLTELVPAL